MNAPENLDQDTLQAVGALLADSYLTGVGVTFLPTQGGWGVDFLDGRRGGPLGEGSDLRTAAVAARETLRRGWPRRSDDDDGSSIFTVILPDRDEAITWHADVGQPLCCIARTVSNQRCRNGVFDGQPGRYVDILGGPGGVAFDIENDWRDHGRRADSQRCNVHVDRENPDMVAHEGVRHRVTQRDWGTAFLE